ncbi:NAD(P)/FAD-dependent oxidoreductase [Oryzifoliimicrobium ureilyticus]|uniref:NAD(P)/FAD-dependent oxidoreductase n=1 Tax=Oryzifoliimicrobium ureilyticus TaxID=3113724 RepID=UPI003075F385
MFSHFKTIVVGRGMMGAAAAKYLARSSDGVAVIGPDEPEDRVSHQGVFGSHYDEGRITRTIDRDHDWAMLANRSIARYAGIAEESDIAFFTEAGCLAVAPEATGQTHDWARIAREFDVATEEFVADGLEARFPFFAFPDGCSGVFEMKKAGHISPRRLVKAQSFLAEQSGATVIRDYAVSVREENHKVLVTTSRGERFSADRVLVTAGAFSIAKELLPRKLDMKVYGRTVVLFEVSDAQAEAFASMPSLILDAPGIDIYLLPPIRYPDGKLYLKIGGDPNDLEMQSDLDLRRWFHGDGRQSARDYLQSVVEQIVPRLKPASIRSMPCALSHTPSKYPMIGFASSRIGVTVGCGGASAKSSDEIGRLGAELIEEGRIITAGYRNDFTPSFK